MTPPSSLVPSSDNTPEQGQVRTSNLPPQLSEATFRFYEPFINSAVKRWPEETQWHHDVMKNEEGKTVSPHTFIARFRDALVSLKRFGWTTYIDTNKLWSIAGKHCCAYGEDGSVWFKERGRRGRPLDMVDEARKHNHPAAAPVVQSWRTPSDDEVRALALLIDGGRLVGPFLLHTQLNDETITALENEFNVAFVWDDLQKVTIVT